MPRLTNANAEGFRFENDFDESDDFFGSILSEAPPKKKNVSLPQSKKEDAADFGNLFGDAELSLEESLNKKSLIEKDLVVGNASTTEQSKQNTLNEVYFKKLLDITAEVYRNKERELISLTNAESPYKTVYSFLNVKPKSLQAELTKSIMNEFLQYMDDKHAIYWRGKKVPKEIAIAMQNAFKIVSGHTFSSFLNVMKAKNYDAFGRETIKALNYLKISNVIPNEAVKYFQNLDADKATVEKVMAENQGLFYPSFALIGFKGLNQYQEFKAYLTDKGLTKKGWKFMCSQSRNYNLRAIRKPKVAIFCLNNGLKDAWLRNTFLAAWMTHSTLVEKSDILFKEIEAYEGPVNSFSPFEIEMRRNHGLMSYECPQLDELNDYLTSQKRDFLRNPANRNKEFKEDSKTLYQLLRRSERWHEEERHKDRGANKQFFPFDISNSEFKGFSFKQITSSWDLIDEGKKMHHCVGSYAERCYKTEYAVYQVEDVREEKEVKVKKGKKEKAERATLGLFIDTATKIDEKTGKEKEILVAKFNQMYRHSNQRASDEMREAANEMIKELNKSFNIPFNQ